MPAPISFQQPDSGSECVFRGEGEGPPGCLTTSPTLPGTVLVLALSVLAHLPGSPPVPGKAGFSVPLERTQSALGQCEEVFRLEGVVLLGLAEQCWRRG